ncbi:MAG: cytochrome ubiquinol oxidase subunit I [Gammaproteobacteria bacterium]
MDTLAILLSRIQFAITVGFHIMFPALNIGLALFIMVMEYRWLTTNKEVYLHICKFWTKIFALTFGMGVVSGIFMSYELGTNFGRYTDAIGGVLGPLFAYEVLSAFFLEAGFLGIMLFGWKKVSPKMHFTATTMVALGTAFSAFWIMAANTWMQTPQGYHIVDHKFVVDSWIQVIFNPSFLVSFVHMVLASYITCSFFIAGVCAYYLLKNKHLEVAKKCFSFALGAAVILLPIQLYLGDDLGLKVYEHQPLKTASIEGLWDTQEGAPLLLFAIPSEKHEKNFFPIAIPYGASLINTHQLNGKLIGLKSVSRADRPVVLPTFFGFRIMVGIGIIMLLTAFYSLYLRRRQRLYNSRLLQYTCLFLAPMGFVATIAGWITTESGRQPWVVYHLLRTADGASKLAVEQVATSLILISLVYLLILSFYLYYLWRLIQQGPAHTMPQEKQLDDVVPPFTYMEKKKR